MIMSLSIVLRKAKTNLIPVRQIRIIEGFDPKVIKDQKFTCSMASLMQILWHDLCEFCDSSFRDVNQNLVI